MSIATFSAIADDTINNALVNSKVQRNIDVSDHLPKISSVITLENTGKSTVQSFLFAVDGALSSYLSYIGASVSVLNNMYISNS